MSEEEIIENIKILIDFIKKSHLIENYEPYKIEIALQGLLDLYNKEKLNSFKFSEQLDKEKEKNKTLKQDFEAGLYMPRADVEEYYIPIENLEDYISKDKIKEIIYPTPENYISLEIQQSDMYKKLESLLED